MYRFFRHIRKTLVEHLPTGPAGSKVRTYLFYAIGEIALVMIGILLALQVNNWNEERKDRAQASQYTERLINDISKDKERLQYRIKFFETVMDFATQARIETEMKRARDIQEKWEYLLAVFHASQTWPYEPADATYIDLQNSGLLGYLGGSEVQNTLSLYYTDNPLQLNQLVGGTQAYRDYSRSRIPITIQSYIWEKCFRIEGLEMQVFGDCDLPAGEEESVEKVYAKISRDPNYLPLLTRQHATLLVRNQVLADMQTLADETIELLK